MCCADPALELLVFGEMQAPNDATNVCRVILLDCEGHASEGWSNFNTGICWSPPVPPRVNASILLLHDAAWIPSGFAGFLTLCKNIHPRRIGKSKFCGGVCECEWWFVSLCGRGDSSHLRTAGIFSSNPPWPWVQEKWVSKMNEWMYNELIYDHSVIWGGRGDLTKIPHRMQKYGKTRLAGPLLMYFDQQKTKITKLWKRNLSVWWGSTKKYIYVCMYKMPP